MGDATRDARALLADARRVVVLTGAGMSAESGVPTFRGEDGLWKDFRPEELATPEAFGRDPCLVWEWYAWRRRLISACAPHEGHRALARLGLRQRVPTVVTQNVDGLHTRAAREVSPTDPPPEASLPLELHGAIHRDRCTRCGRRSEGTHAIDASHPHHLPRCAACGGLLRPDVVWFGEALDPGVLQESFRLAREADVCLVVGTSAVVHPAASLPLATVEAGGRIVEVNPDETPLSRLAAVRVRGGAAETLPAILEEP